MTGFSALRGSSSFTKRHFEPRIERYEEDEDREEKESISEVGATCIQEDSREVGPRPDISLQLVKSTGFGCRGEEVKLRRQHSRPPPFKTENKF